MRRLCSLSTLALAASCGCACAQDAPPPHEDKLTLGFYRYQAAAGRDVNMRWQRGDSHYWVGAYDDHEVGVEGRAGADTAWSPAPWLMLQPSVQWATGGFVGGSLNLQLGDPFFALAGWGRTNLKPYFNLNFDPNDAYTAGAGWRGAGDTTWTTFVVADDRLHTGQKHWHTNLRTPLPGGDRLTLDVLRKSGATDGGHVRAWGYSVQYDGPAWFLKVARDPYQNFSAVNALRVSVGRRW